LALVDDDRDRTPIVVLGQLPDADKLVHFPTVFQGWKNDQGFLSDIVLGNPLNRHLAALDLEKFLAQLISK